MSFKVVLLLIKIVAGFYNKALFEFGSQQRQTCDGYTHIWTHLSSL